MGSFTEEAIGNIRANGMRYAGQMADGTEVIHTPFDITPAQSTVMSFNQAAKKVESEIICGYPAGALDMPGQDQLDVIRLSYPQEVRNQIGPVWSREYNANEADVQIFCEAESGGGLNTIFIGDGYRDCYPRGTLAQTCFVPK